MDFINDHAIYRRVQIENQEGIVTGVLCDYGDLDGQAEFCVDIYDGIWDVFQDDIDVHKWTAVDVNAYSLIKILPYDSEAEETFYKKERRRR